MDQEDPWQPTSILRRYGISSAIRVSWSPTLIRHVWWSSIRSSASRLSVNRCQYNSWPR